MAPAALPPGTRRRVLESVVAHHQATHRFGRGIVDVAAAEPARRELLLRP